MIFALEGASVGSNVEGEGVLSVGEDVELGNIVGLLVPLPKVVGTTVGEEDDVVGVRVPFPV